MSEIQIAAAHRIQRKVVKSDHEIAAPKALVGLLVSFLFNHNYTDDGVRHRSNPWINVHHYEKT